MHQLIGEEGIRTDEGGGVQFLLVTPCSNELME